MCWLPGHANDMRTTKRFQYAKEYVWDVLACGRAYDICTT